MELFDLRAVADMKSFDFYFFHPFCFWTIFLVDWSPKIKYAIKQICASKRKTFRVQF